jgi:hypothetical protein
MHLAIEYDANEWLGFTDRGMNEVGMQFARRLRLKTIAANYFAGQIGNVAEYIAQAAFEAEEIAREAIDADRQTIVGQIENRGRVLSGLMKNNLNSMSARSDPVGFDARGRYSARIGWYRNQPEYAVFQEHGTRYIPPMLALAQGIRHLEQRLADIANGDY